MFADPRHPIQLAVCTLFLALASSAVSAHGQTVAGQWRAGTTTMDVTVTSWGPDCGPRPSSSHSAGGGLVRIEMSGQEAIIHSGGRKIRTDRCWSRNPAIRRKSSHFVAGTWTTHCQTAKDDPRAETGKYSLQQQSKDRLRYVDESEYDWELNASRCVAAIRTVQQLHRSPLSEKKQGPSITPDTSPSSASAPTPATASPKKRGAPEVKPKQCTPSVATRLTMQPTRATLELGEEVCVRARLSDALGCPVPGTAIRYTLHTSPALKGTLRGRCFRSSDNAAEGEGRFRIRATAGPLSAVTTVEVHSLDLSALIAQRLEVVGIPNQASGAVGAPTAPATRRPTTHISTGTAVAEAHGPSLLSIALATMAIIVLMAGYWSIRRKPREKAIHVEPALGEPASTPEERHATTPPPPFATPSSDGKNVGAPLPDAQDSWICPLCRRGQPAMQATCSICPGDVKLMPYARFVASIRRNHSPRQCRTCGTISESDARFCGECGGTELAPTSSD